MRKTKVLIIAAAMLTSINVFAEIVVDGLIYEKIGDAKVAVTGIINVTDYLEAHNNSLDIPATIVVNGETFTVTRIDKLPSIYTPSKESLYLTRWNT